MQDTVTQDTYTMRTTDTRRKRFKAALALAGLTLAKWADKEGVTRQHVNEVLKGERVSAPLNEKIDRFIESYLVAA